jgi:DNA invertase Pin-like site-specific DNA recombinase
VASGAKTDREQLRRALDQLNAGDVRMVTRLDRLGLGLLTLYVIIALVYRVPNPALSRMKRYRTLALRV